jgi:hypothetical protein
MKTNQVNKNQVKASGISAEFLSFSNNEVTAFIPHKENAKFADAELTQSLAMKVCKAINFVGFIRENGSVAMQPCTR